MAIPFLKGIDVTGTVDLSNLTIDGAQGTDGQVLTSTGTGIAWEDASGGGGITMSGGVNDRLLTATSASAIKGEANLQYNGSFLKMLSGVRMLGYNPNGGNFQLRSDNPRRYGMNSYETGITALTTENRSDYAVGNSRAVTALVLGNTPFGTASASSGKDIFNITRVNQAAYGPSSGMGSFSKVLNLRGNGDLYLGHTSSVGAVYATKYYDKASTAYYLDPGSTGVALHINGIVDQDFQVTNLNSAWTAPGTSRDQGFIFGRFQSSASNAPGTNDNANWFANIYSHASGGTASYGIQLAGSNAGSGENALQLRNVSNGSFASWRKVFHDGYHPNADTWTTSRTLTLNGDVSGSVSWDGSANATLTTTVGNDSHDHTRITERSTITYGAGQLQWTDLSGTGGAGTNGNAPGNPFSDWHHHIIMNHANSNGYYVDMAFSFHNDRVHFRRLENGSFGSWREFFHTGHVPTYSELGTMAYSNLTGTPSSLPANGGNSDTVDNLHAASFLRSDANDTFTGKLSVGSTDIRRAGIYGIYDSYRIGHIWSMGTGYNIANNGADFGNLYGLAYKHTNNTTGGTMGGSHQMVWCNNGSPRGSIGYNSVWHAESMKAPIFYDSNDTNYKLDPNGTSNLNHLNVAGTFRFQRSAYTQTGQDDNVTVTVGDSDITFTHNNDDDGDASVYNFKYTSGGSAIDILNFASSYAAFNTPYVRCRNNSTDYAQLESNSSGGVLKAVSNGNTNVLFRSYGDSYTLNDLGVGISTPAARLHVDHPTTTTPVLSFGGAAGQILQSENSEFAFGLTAASPYPLYIQGRSSANLARDINLQPISGDIGIGVASPGYRLDVNGTIRATGDVIAYSDIRVKENIKTIDNALNKVKNLRGVEYNKIDSTEKNIGVIAQEVEKILPEVVKTDEEGMKSVAYGNITAVLIEAIKDQQKQIDELKSIINGSS